MMKLRFLALTAALALAACGGGGGGSSPVNPPGAPTAPTGPTNTQQNPTASITIRIPIPSRPTGTVRRPQYVSPDTASLEVRVNSVDTGSGPAAPPSWVNTDSITALTVGTNCTLGVGTESCTVAVPAPVGTVNYTFDALDGSNAVLSTATVNEVIVQGSSNSLSATLQGVVHSVNVVPLATPAPSFATPGSHPIAMAVYAYDADGDLIVDPGNYANAFTLTDPETATSGATSLSDVEGSGASIIVGSPDDVVNLEWNGAAINSFTITVSGSIPGGGGTVACLACDVTVGTPSDIVFTGTTDDTTPNGGLVTDANWGQQTVYFSQASGTQDISAGELSFTGGFGGTYLAALDPTTCNGVALISSSDGLTFIVTAIGVGVCKAQLSEASTSISNGGYPLTNPGHPASVPGNETQNGTFWISVTSSSFGIDSHGRRPPTK